MNYPSMRIYHPKGDGCKREIRFGEKGFGPIIDVISARDAYNNIPPHLPRGTVVILTGAYNGVPALIKEVYCDTDETGYCPFCGRTTEGMKRKGEKIK